MRGCGEYHPTFLRPRPPDTTSLTLDTPSSIAAAPERDLLQTKLCCGATPSTICLFRCCHCDGAKYIDEIRRARGSVPMPFRITTSERGIPCHFMANTLGIQRKSGARSAPEDFGGACTGNTKGIQIIYKTNPAREARRRNLCNFIENLHLTTGPGPGRPALMDYYSGGSPCAALEGALTDYYFCEPETTMDPGG